MNVYVLPQLDSLYMNKGRHPRSRDFRRSFQITQLQFVRTDPSKSQTIFIHGVDNAGEPAIWLFDEFKRFMAVVD